MAIGLKHERIKNFFEAEKAFLTVLQNSPLKSIFSIAHIKLIECSLEQNKYNETIEYISINFSNIDSLFLEKLYYYTGFCYERLFLREKSIENYQKVIEFNSPLSKVCEAWTFILKKDFSEAQRCLISLSERQKINTQGYLDCQFLLSQYYFSMENYEKALFVLNKIIIPNQNLDVYLCNLGIACKKLMNSYDSAFFMLQSAKTNPRRVETWYNLALLYNTAQQKDSDLALSKARVLDKNKVLPLEINENNQLLSFGINFANFEENIELSTENVSKNFLKIEKIEFSADKIVVPQPVKLERALVVGKNCENEGIFIRKDWLEFSKRFNFFVKNQTQAAEILSEIAKLPQKRQRSIRKKINFIE